MPGSFILAQGNYDSMEIVQNSWIIASPSIGGRKSMYTACCYSPPQTPRSRPHVWSSLQSSQAGLTNLHFAEEQAENKGRKALHECYSA